MIMIVLFVATWFLACAKGANDSLKCAASRFGIGAVTGQAHPCVMRNILLSWIATLPCAALLSAGATALLRHL